MPNFITPPSPDQRLQRVDTLSQSAAAQPATSGRQVRSGARQSIPSNSIDSCAGVSRTTPSAGEGQMKRPFSSRLANKHSPCASQYSALIKSPRRPRKQKTWPENGSCLQHRLHLHRQPVHALAHVGPATGQKHLHTGRQPDHRATPSASRTRRNASAST